MAGNIQAEIPNQLAAKGISPGTSVRPENQWLRPDATKSCSKCERVLPVDSFRPNSRLGSGLDSWCRECHIEANRRSRARHRDEYNARQRARYHASKND